MTAKDTTGVSNTHLKPKFDKSHKSTNKQTGKPIISKSSCKTEKRRVD